MWDSLKRRFTSVLYFISSYFINLYSYISRSICQSGTYLHFSFPTLWAFTTSWSSVIQLHNISDTLYMSTHHIYIYIYIFVKKKYRELIYTLFGLAVFWNMRKTQMSRSPANLRKVAFGLVWIGF